MSDSLSEASALTDLGDTQRLAGHYPAALRLLARATDTYRAAENDLGEANALNELGAARYHSQDHQAAARDLARAVELYRRLGEAQALNHLGAGADHQPAAPPGDVLGGRERGVPVRSAEFAGWALLALADLPAVDDQVVVIGHAVGSHRAERVAGIAR